MRSGRPLLFCILCCITYHMSWSQDITDSVFLKDIDRDVTGWMKKGNIPGCSVALVSDGVSIIRCYGYANTADRIPVSSGTLFELASCSKAFTALAVLKLAASGLIDLHDCVSWYIPWFRPTYKDSPVSITL